MYEGSVFISNSGRGELSVYPRIPRAWVCIQGQICPVITDLSVQGTHAVTEIPAYYEKRYRLCVGGAATRALHGKQPWVSRR